jgi:hypothetical protein
MHARSAPNEMQIKGLKTYMIHSKVHNMNTSITVFKLTLHKITD